MVFSGGCSNIGDSCSANSYVLVSGDRPANSSSGDTSSCVLVEDGESYTRFF